MSEEIDEDEEAPKKSSKMPLILGVVLALVGGGGGFFAVSSGMLLGSDTEMAEEEIAPELEALPDIAYVPVAALTVSLGSGTEMKHLRFRAQIEVPAVYKPDVELILPRIVDVLNSYLRALKVADIESPAALTRLRGQMLRRIKVVTGQERVNDLLVMEFVIN